MDVEFGAYTQRGLKLASLRLHCPHPNTANSFSDFRSLWSKVAVLQYNTSFITEAKYGTCSGQNIFTHG